MRRVAVASAAVGHGDSQRCLGVLGGNWSCSWGFQQALRARGDANIVVKVTSHVVDSRDCNVHAHCGEGEMNKVRRRNARVKVRPAPKVVKVSVHTYGVALDSIISLRMFLV